MKVLVVGAGAVGQVYAYHLFKGGARVSFLVRQPRKLTEHPLRLYPLSLLKHAHPFFPPSFAKYLPPPPFNSTAPSEPLLFSDYEVFDLNTLETLAKGSSEMRKKAADYDAVILTVPSNRLREDGGAWLERAVRYLEQADGGKRTIRVVSFCPAGSDLEFIAEKVKIPRARLLKGSIALISYQAPLPTQCFDPIPPEAYTAHNGSANPNPLIAYAYAPAPMGQPISAVTTESEDFAKELCDAFTRGGLPATRVPLKSQERDLAVVGNFVLPFLVALESKGWNFDALTGDWTALRELVSAMKETMEISLSSGIAPLRHTINAPMLYLFLKALPAMCRPLLDIEALIRYHFSKVGDQTVLHASLLVEEGARAGREMPNFRKLCAKNARVGPALKS